jgi:hypothetical protein
MADHPRGLAAPVNPWTYIESDKLPDDRFLLNPTSSTLLDILKVAGI